MNWKVLAVLLGIAVAAMLWLIYHLRQHVKAAITAAMLSEGH